LPFPSPALPTRCWKLLRGGKAPLQPPGEISHLAGKLLTQQSGFTSPRASGKQDLEPGRGSGAPQEMGQGVVGQAVKPHSPGAGARFFRAPRGSPAGSCRTRPGQQELTESSCLRRRLRCRRRRRRPPNCQGGGRESGVRDGGSRPSPSPRAEPRHRLTSDSWDNADAGYHAADSRDGTSAGQDAGSCRRGADRQLGDTGTQPASPQPGRQGGSPRGTTHRISLLPSPLPPALRLLGRDVRSR